jgi:hypothetical protein
MIRKDLVIHDNNDSSSSSIFRAKVITVVGLVLVIAGITGTIYYGSQFVREEVDPNMNPPYTTAPQIKNTIPLELEIALVVVTILGFGILSFGVVAYKFDKPLDFYPV